MAASHRRIQRSVFHKDDADAASVSSESSWNSRGSTSSKRKYRKSTRSIDLSTAVAIAAFSASLAVIVTAIGATYFITSRYEWYSDSLMSSTTSTVVTRTIRPPSFFDSSGRSAEYPLADSTAMTNKEFIQIQSSHKENGRQDREAYDNLNPVLEQNDDTDEDLQHPKVAWLMSFPNSGTSYTIHLTREASNTTTATNYALEGDIKDKPSVPAIEGEENGPYLELIPNRFTTIPKYILTKTHCGGFCASCPPVKYIETPRSFQVSCQSGRRAKLTDSGKLKLEAVTYRGSLVKKAVHVIRHPLDNIVARFHLEYRRHERRNNTKWIADHPYNSTGFHEWCRIIDGDNELEKLRWVDRALAHSLKKVPCQAEFFRYIQWHNLAFSLTRDMGIPTHVIHYNDYRDDFEGTLNRLLNFLELPRVGDGMEFSSGKEYKDYYTPEQRQAVNDFVKELSTLETWRELKKYNFS